MVSIGKNSIIRAGRILGLGLYFHFIQYSFILFLLAELPVVLAHSFKPIPRCPSTGELAQCSFPPCPCPVGPTDRNMMYENRMLGVPRMRQLKVTNTSCLSDMNKDFKSAIRKCYAPYGLRDEDEDRASYIPEHRYCILHQS